MFDPSPQRGPETPSEKWIVGIIVVIATALLLVELGQNFQPAKLSFLFFLLFWCPLLVLHEAGHALMAAAMGWSVDRIVIGIGKPLKRFRLGRVDVEWRLLPLEGFVRCRPQNLALPRLKNALIYFAGPGIELLLAAVILWLVGPRLLQPSNQLGLIIIQSLAATSCFSGIVNLIPFSAQTPERTIVNDGLGILLTLLTPRQQYLEQLKGMMGDREDR